MALTTNKETNLFDAINRVVGHIADAQRIGKRSIVFIPTNDLKEEIFRQIGKENLNTLGVSVSTFEEWFADQWELYGNERRMVSSFYRRLFVHEVVRTTKTGLLDCPGVEDTITNLAQDFLPEITSLTAQTSRDAGFTKMETFVCLALNGYSSLLKERGYIELSEAVTYLPLYDQFEFIYLKSFEDEYCLQRFLDIQGKATQARIVINKCSSAATCTEKSEELKHLSQALYQSFKGEKRDVVKSYGDVQVVMPSGKNVSPRLVANEIAKDVEKFSTTCNSLKSNGLIEDSHSNKETAVLVLSSNPFKDFYSIAPRLLSENVSCGLVGSIPVTNTQIGRAFVSLINLISSHHWNHGDVIDFLVDSKVGLSKQHLWEIDNELRAHRWFSNNDVIESISKHSEVIRTDISLAQNGEFARLFDSYESRLKIDSKTLSIAEKAELACLHALKNIEMARHTGSVSWAECIDLLSQMKVSVRFNENAPVVIKQFSTVTFEQTCKYQSVYILDTDSSTYSIKPKEDALFTIKKKLGYEDPYSQIEKYRRYLMAAVDTASQKLTVHRCLNNEKAEVLSNASFADELYDCYTYDIQSNEEFQKDSGVSNHLPVIELGEEDFVQNLVSCSDISIQEFALSEPMIVAPEHAFKVLTRAQKNGTSYPQLSPSAIENYLECPFKWFANRRLRLNYPDSEFGNKEIGSFVHSVLEEFYSALFGEGFKRVTSENLSFAQSILDKVFDENLASQAGKDKGSNPLIPTNAFERESIVGLKKQLMKFIEKQIEFLPNYHPIAMELKFGFDTVFEYAGFAVQGTIDRIDEDDSGHIVIIDYKGSLSKDYDCTSMDIRKNEGLEQLTIPNKIQALIYAQVAKALYPDKQIAGALYLCYGKHEGVRGVYDPRLMGPEDIGSINPKHASLIEIDNSRFCSIEELLVAVEDDIKTRFIPLLSGDVAPKPRSKSACDYCPVSRCVKREEQGGSLYESR